MRVSLNLSGLISYILCQSCWIRRTRKESVSRLSLEYSASNHAVRAVVVVRRAQVAPDSNRVRTIGQKPAPAGGQRAVRVQRAELESKLIGSSITELMQSPQFGSSTRVLGRPVGFGSCNTLDFGERAVGRSKHAHTVVLKEATRRCWSPNLKPQMKSTTSGSWCALGGLRTGLEQRPPRSRSREHKSSRKSRRTHSRLAPDANDAHRMACDSFRCTDCTSSNFCSLAFERRKFTRIGVSAESVCSAVTMNGRFGGSVAANSPNSLWFDGSENTYS